MVDFAHDPPPPPAGPAPQVTAVGFDPAALEYLAGVGERFMSIAFRKWRDVHHQAMRRAAELAAARGLPTAVMVEDVRRAYRELGAVLSVSTSETTDVETGQRIIIDDPDCEQDPGEASTPYQPPEVARISILISGERGSGKTTLLRFLGRMLGRYFSNVKCSDEGGIPAQPLDLDWEPHPATPVTIRVVASE